MSQPLLEVYFKARSNTVKLPSGDSEGPVTEAKPALIEKKFLQMLGICLQKYVMAHKGETDSSAIMCMKRGVLRCDYNEVKQEALALIRAVLGAHREDGSKITQLVEKSGEGALVQLEQSNYHRLVYELLKVPQIDERLECMLFQTDFDVSFRKCTKHLDIVKQALEALNRKRELLSKFFCTALRMGQGLNRDSRAPLPERGFQLASLDKLAQTKSTRSPKHSVLHFVLALMEPEDAQQLFTKEDRAILNGAKTLRSHGVYQECMELVQSFYGLREICETGNYKGNSGKEVKMERRRKTMVPGARPAKEAPDSGKENESPLDSDDCFHDTMKAFVELNFKAARGVADEVFSVFKLYKDLGIFFDDLSSVWPPPREDNSTKSDLIVVFSNFAEDVRLHCEDVEKDGLRALIAPPPAAPAENTEGSPEEVPSAPAA